MEEILILDIETRTLTINTIVSGTSNFTSISLYVNGVKQYTTPESGSSSDYVNNTVVYEDVYEAYIVFERAMHEPPFSNSCASVNGVNVFTNEYYGATYDLLALGTDTITIQTYLAD